MQNTPLSGSTVVVIVGFVVLLGANDCFDTIFFDEIVIHDKWCIRNHLMYIFAQFNSSYALFMRHDRTVLVTHDVFIVMDPDDDIVAKLQTVLEKVHMPSMTHIKDSTAIHPLFQPKKREIECVTQIGKKLHIISDREKDARPIT
eukprot:GSChrysophyteH1.ASY1.ANO1.598.1 assembled CDS